MKRLPISELTRLAFIYAEQDRMTMAEAAKGMPEGEEAEQLACQMNAYRVKRWGRTAFEATLSEAELVDVSELRKRIKP